MLQTSQGCAQPSSESQDGVGYETQLYAPSLEVTGQLPRCLLGLDPVEVPFLRPSQQPPRLKTLAPGVDRHYTPCLHSCQQLPALSGSELQSLTKDHLRWTIVTGGHDGRVMLMVKGSTAEVSHSDAGVLH